MAVSLIIGLIDALGESHPKAMDDPTHSEAEQWHAERAGEHQPEECVALDLVQPRVGRSISAPQSGDEANAGELRSGDARRGRPERDNEPAPQCQHAVAPQHNREWPEEERRQFAHVLPYVVRHSSCCISHLGAWVGGLSMTASLRS